MRDFSYKIPVHNDTERYYDRTEAKKRARERSQAEDNLSLTEAIDLIELYLKVHQLSFIPHKSDPTLFRFPFMFRKPAIGSKIVNITTNEIYTVQQLLDDPDENRWNGVIKLNIEGNPPSNQERHALVYAPSDKDNYVVFESEFPSVLVNQSSSNTDGISNSVPPLSPTITWSVVSSTPGSLDKISSNKVELSPRLRETKKDPLVPGYSIEIFGQTIDNFVQFDIWSTKPKESEDLIRWFQGFMAQYSYGLKRCGLKEVLFNQRLTDDLKRTWRQGVYVKSLQYFMRTEELSQRYERDLVKLDISVDIASSGLTRTIDLEERYIAGQKVTGQITDEDYNNLFYRSGEYMFGETYYNQ